MNLDKTLKLSIITGALLTGFSFFFYFVVFLPQKERTRIKENAEASSKLVICLQAAEKAGTVLWDVECLKMGQEPGCSLPPELADPMDDNLWYVREECFRKYPQR